MRDVLHIRRQFGIMAILLAAIFLTACGSGDADEDPTATSAPSDAQPTVVADETTPAATAQDATGSSTSIPTNVDMSGATFDSTPDATIPAVSATPDGDRSGIPGSATPDTTMRDTPEMDAGAATPAVASEASESDAVTMGTPIAGASPVAGEAIPAAPGVGDGTTGAMIMGTPGVDDTGAAATPIADDTADAASPVASPAASSGPVTVTGCDVSEVPAFDEEQTVFTLTTDLNFRVGPGAECDLALDDPIGEFQTVEVIGGPVVREDDGTEWVQLRVNDTEGWVVFEFLEPVVE